MRWFMTLIVALAAGFAGAALWDASGLGGKSTRDYLLANPEILPEAMQVLQQRDQQARIAPLRHELEAPFPGAVLGNPAGSVTLVEFSDYGCSYCRQSVADVAALVAANPDLKVVVREYPILAPERPSVAESWELAWSCASNAPVAIAARAWARSTPASFAAASIDCALGGPSLYIASWKRAYRPCCAAASAMRAASTLSGARIGYSRTTTFRSGLAATRAATSATLWRQ